MQQNSPDWITMLRADVADTGSISATAKRVGVSRPAISQVINGIGPYGTGKASTDKLQEKVLNTIGRIECPFLTEYHGEERRITGLECREFAYRDKAPTNSPRDLQHWLACQECPKRVKETKARPKLDQVLKRAQQGQEQVQQAGIIDKVTLPLPEVGGPQVEEGGK